MQLIKLIFQNFKTRYWFQVLKRWNLLHCKFKFKTKNKNLQPTLYPILNPVGRHSPLSLSQFCYFRFTFCFLQPSHTLIHLTNFINSEWLSKSVISNNVKCLTKTWIYCIIAFISVPCHNYFMKEGKRDWWSMTNPLWTHPGSHGWSFPF